MKKLMAVIKDRNHFQIFGDIAKAGQNSYEVKELQVAYNGEESELFKETCIGNNLSATDVTNMLIKAYLHGDNMQFVLVCDEIDDMKAEYKKQKNSSDISIKVLT